jgi:hypothetical protein
MAITQVPPPRAPAQQAGATRSRGPLFEPTWGVTMMLQDVLYLLRLRHRRSAIDF